MNARQTPFEPLAAAGLFSVAAAVEFARLHRGDCSTLITYVALRETGMLDAYMEKIALSGSVPPSAPRRYSATVFTRSLGNSYS